MHRFFTSFADFEGCTDDERLWHIEIDATDSDGWTVIDHAWCVSDLPLEDVENLAGEYAAKTYGDALSHVYANDASDPHMLGNFATWYANPDNRATFLEACKMQKLRDELLERATSMLEDAGLEANLEDIWNIPMQDINDKLATREETEK